MYSVTDVTIELCISIVLSVPDAGVPYLLAINVRFLDFYRMQHQQKDTKPVELYFRQCTKNNKNLPIETNHATITEENADN